MIKVENIAVSNFESAIRGMRNPLNSWKRMDSVFEPGKVVLGSNDLNLAQKLVKSGSDHSKFLRQIFVSMDITAPLYWWKEMDTYKVGTTANSTSTMHTLIKKEITKDMFSFDDLNMIIAEGHSTEGKWVLTFKDCVEEIITICNDLREKFLKTGDKRYWRALVQILPNAWNQTRTWTANYQILRHIYFARKNHKLSEWHTFCEAIEKLPFSKELITIS